MNTLHAMFGISALLWIFALCVAADAGRERIENSRYITDHSCGRYPAEQRGICYVTGFDMDAIRGDEPPKAGGRADLGTSENG